MSLLSLMACVKKVCYPLNCLHCMLMIISKALEICGVGCYINNTSVNHFFNADDICIAAPSPKALQIILNM